MEIYNATNGIISSSEIFEVSGNGIKVLKSSHIVIESNICSDNSGDGIYIDSSYYSEVKNNTCIRNNLGIGLRDKYGSSRNYNQITWNNCSYNKEGGIVITRGIDDTINYNKLINNTNYGIWVECTFWPYSPSADDNIEHNFIIGSTDGITLLGTDSPYFQVFETKLIHNIIKNTSIGIFLFSASYNDIEYNNISMSDKGIYLSPAYSTSPNKENLFYKNTIRNCQNGMYLKKGSQNNTIYWNSFYYNKQQAYDDGSGNKWYKNGHGNYWSDWTSPDENNDGIVDYPYNINGSAGSIDKYPLVHPSGAHRPSAPANLKAHIGNKFVNLSWNPPADDGGLPIQEYRIYKNSTVIGTTTRLWYNDTNVNNGVKYSYYVTAVNDVGEGKPSNEINATPSKIPDSPLNLTAIGGVGYVMLVWEPPIYNGGSLIKYYNIYRGISPSDLRNIGTSENRSYNDTNVMNGVTYYYAITAVNSVGESEKSNEISVTTMDIPNAPENLQATVEYGYVNLIWQPPTDDGGSKIIAYKIYRGTSSGNETYIGQVNGSTFNYTDKNIRSGATYYYYVTAVNSVGESNKSNEVSISIPAKKSGIPWFWIIILGVVLAGIIIGILLMINWKGKNKKISTKGSAE